MPLLSAIHCVFFIFFPSSLLSFMFISPLFYFLFFWNLSTLFYTQLLGEIVLHVNIQPDSFSTQLILNKLCRCAWFFIFPYFSLLFLFLCLFLSFRIFFRICFVNCSSFSLHIFPIFLPLLPSSFIHFPFLSSFVHRLSLCVSLYSLLYSTHMLLIRADISIKGLTLSHPNTAGGDVRGVHCCDGVVY